MLGSGWGELGGVKAVMARECVECQVVRVALCISLFVLHIIYIVVTVCFIYCSVKLPLS